MQMLSRKVENPAFFRPIVKSNRERFPGFEVYQIPRYSRIGNPDNVLTASNAVPRDLQEKLVVAAMHNNQAFDARQVRMFDPGTLQFSSYNFV